MIRRPLRQTLILGSLFILLVLPLLWVTRYAGVAVTTETDSQLDSKESGVAGKKIQAFFTVRSAHEFSTCRLTLSDGQIYEFTGPVKEVDGEMTLELPGSVLKAKDQKFIDHTKPQGIQTTFLIEAEWPAGTPETALLVQIEPDSLATKSTTLWATESLRQELVFYFDK